MSSIWMDPVCAGCGEAIADQAKAVAIVPCTTRAKGSWAAGRYGNRGQLRVMPSKGRKGQQKPLMYHERCWPKIEAPPTRQKNTLCPYPLHADDCTCRGMGGDR